MKYEKHKLMSLTLNDYNIQPFYAQEDTGVPFH